MVKSQREPAAAAAAALALPTEGDRFRVGDALELTWGESLLAMRDSTAIFNDTAALLHQLDTNGYILLRNVIPIDVVQRARNIAVETLEGFDQLAPPPSSTAAASALERAPQEGHGRHQATAGGVSIHDACLARQGADPALLLTGFTPATDRPEFQRAVQGEEVVELFRRLFSADPATFRTKWLRCLGPQGKTGEHTDSFRFMPAIESLFTCWIPLGAYGPRDSCLVVCPGTHLLPQERTDAVARDSGESELPDDYVKSTRRIWHSTHFSMGDVVVFDIRLVHASSVNETDRFRLSCDTRWQPADIACGGDRERHDGDNSSSGPRSMPSRFQRFPEA